MGAVRRKNLAKVAKGSKEKDSISVYLKADLIRKLEAFAEKKQWSKSKAAAVLLEEAVNGKS